MSADSIKMVIALVAALVAVASLFVSFVSLLVSRASFTFTRGITLSDRQDRFELQRDALIKQLLANGLTVEGLRAKAQFLITDLTDLIYERRHNYPLLEAKTASVIDDLHKV